MIITGIFYELGFGGGLDTLIIPFIELRKGISFGLLAVFLFVLLGNLMNKAQLSTYLVDFVSSLVPRLPGKRGAILSAGCAMVGPLTGSANGTAIGVGTIMIPQLQKAGYDSGYSTALLAYSAILGALIPPSISGLVYALVTRQSVLAVWMSIFGAGLLYLVVLLALNFIRSYWNRYDTDEENEPVTRRALLSSFIKILPAMLVPLAILGGIYGGVTTATEAGSLGAIVVLILGTFYYRTIRSVDDVVSVLSVSAYQTAIIMFLVCGSFVISNIMVSTGTAKILGHLMLSWTENKFLLLILTQLLILAFGFFMDDVPIMVMLAPISSSILVPAGIDPLHLAGTFVFVALLAMVTPPVGSVLYASATISGQKVTRILGEILLWFIPALIVMLLITFFPQITMFFPQVMGLAG